MSENKMLENLKILGILILSLCLILLSQFVKYIKTVNSQRPSTPVTKETFLGLIVLGLITIVGIFIQRVMQNQPVKMLKEFPVLGWVSVTSLICCIIFPIAIKLIHAVDFLGITTPILTFAGLSIANRLGDLKRVSWRIIIVGSCVFIGTYLGSAIIAHIGLLLTGK